MRASGNRQLDSLTAGYNPQTQCVAWFHKHLLYFLSHSSCFVCNYSTHTRVLMFYRPQNRHERNSPSTPPSPVAPSNLVRSPLHPQRRTTLMQSSQYTLTSHPSSQTPACGVWSPTSLLFLLSGCGPSAERKILKSWRRSGRISLKAWSWCRGCWHIKGGPLCFLVL